MWAQSVQSAMLVLHSKVMPTVAETKYLGTPLAPRHWLELRKWQERDKTVLRINIAEPNSVPKAYLRRWCGKRVKSAFEEALREGGFAEDGKVLPPKEGMPPSMLRPIRGTAAFQVKKEVMQMRRDAVVQEMRALVTRMARTFQQPEWQKQDDVSSHSESRVRSGNDRGNNWESNTGSENFWRNIRESNGGSDMHRRLGSAKWSSPRNQLGIKPDGWQGLSLLKPLSSSGASERSRSQSY